MIWTDFPTHVALVRFWLRPAMVFHHVQKSVFRLLSAGGERYLVTLAFSLWKVWNLVLCNPNRSPSCIIFWCRGQVITFGVDENRIPNFTPLRGLYTQLWKPIATTTKKIRAKSIGIYWITIHTKSDGLCAPVEVLKSLSSGEGGQFKCHPLLSLYPNTYSSQLE